MWTWLERQNYTSIGSKGVMVIVLTVLVLGVLSYHGMASRSILSQNTVYTGDNVTPEQYLALLYRLEQMEKRIEWPYKYRMLWSTVNGLCHRTKFIEEQLDIGR